MSSATLPPPEASRSFPRVLGRAGIPGTGPTVVILGGIHGNEPAGAHAAVRVIERLVRGDVQLRGTVTAIAGNLEALAADRRFVDVDLNRCWLRERVATLRARDPRTDHAEDREQREILDLLDQAEAEAGDGIVILDLHTTSAAGPPFSLMSDTLRNRRLAFALPVPVILGLEESIDGTLLHYATERGHMALVVEGGQHADPVSVEVHEAVIWLTLATVDAVPRQQIPEHAAKTLLLARVRNGAPRVAEVRHRHDIAEGDAYRMLPGFQGFDRVARDQVVAHDRHGEVACPEDGYILMPLYQELGTDGYFLVRPVRRLWLQVSTVLRRLRLHVFLPLLPGVRRDPERTDTLIADPHVTRWLVVQIFHLFGYRRRREGDNGRLRFTRRRDR